MSTTVYHLLRALSGLETGTWCRRCSQPILSEDAFGVSETVCQPCRREATR